MKATQIGRVLLLGLLLMGSNDLLLGGSPDGDYFLEVNRSIDLFGRVYKEVTANYVDEVQPYFFMEAGIEAMLSSLDPYTIYIDREEGDEVDLLTSGKYGGIGVTIGYREGRIQIITVMDGYSAQRQGISPGDWIVQIDSVPVEGIQPDEVKNLTRGAPGTEVSLTIEREGEEHLLSFVLIREEIRLKDVTYAGFVADGIGYVRLERFSRKAGEEVREAIRELQEKGRLNGIVLDVRGNPGGLLDAAVDVTGKFVPKGSLVVSTKGRRPDADKSYHSEEEPLVPDIPVVILTNRESASASEIVSGAMQDLDRAVIVGERTFGKGLVQTILSLNYGAKLKVTTARYYIPSGRSIQEIDYKTGDPFGLFPDQADTLQQEFRTVGGRVVHEHGGISPDSVVNETDEGPMVEELRRKSMFFRFMNYYAGDQKGALPESVTPAMVDEFRTFLREKGFSHQEDTEARIASVREDSEAMRYSEEILTDIDRLLEKLQSEKERAFDRYLDHIVHNLQIELSARNGGEAGRIRAQLVDDPQLNAAIGLLRDTEAYMEQVRR